MTADGKGQETHAFRTEVARLLDLVVNALYSKKEIFLRELISNASDACDRLRYAALTEPALIAEDAELAIRLRPDKAARTLTVIDNGIGMSREELIEHLGTIAGSGTAAFMAQLSGDKAKDVSLIGQFGVGFYAAFMVAREVAVTSRRAGTDATWTWRSDGKGAFAIEPGVAGPRGTAITLHLKDGEDEHLEPQRLEHIVRTYSDHIGLPILLEASAGAPERLNSAGALWARDKASIDAAQYREFYHHVAHAADEPWLTLHNRNEGTVEYTNLLFVPTRRPFDLFVPERHHRVKLYVKRVFITDDCQDLMPAWLRFVAGVVDCADLPLNVSREMLQANPVVAKIRQGLTKRVLDELARKAKDDADGYAAFWEAFGAVLKEGLYEDHARRDALLGLARFRSTDSDKPVALEDYVARMKPGQDAIFTIAGEDPRALAASPHLEAFSAKGVEVLLLTDPIDEFWVPAVGAFKDKRFVSVTRGEIDLDAIAPQPDAAPKADAADPKVKSLIAVFKLALGDKVKDVRASARLTESPVCLVADANDLDLHVERMLRQHQRVDTTSKRILEVNPGHVLIGALAQRVHRGDAVDAVEEMAHILLDQALILEGETPADGAAFARRLSRALTRGLTA
ncbi:MAG: molecular chaperone HtpG [Alphaproteobacteria bacterium]|nr:molecular chaperone HtpG [Alphaproteobacteria bacterium]